MIIKKFVVGPLENNCFVIVDEASRECFIVDPGDEPGVVGAREARLEAEAGAERPGDRHLPPHPPAPSARRRRPGCSA